MTTPETELKTSDPRDWPEDFSHRDGIYLCGCRLCGERFTGHKRRVLCKVCHTNELRLERDKAIGDLDAARAELAEVRDQLGRDEHFVGCIIQAFHRAGLKEFNVKDIDANIAEVRRRTAQRCAEIADEQVKQWIGKGLFTDAHAVSVVRDEIRREFALAEQPPQPLQCTCGNEGQKRKHHEDWCPLWKQYVRDLDAAVAATEPQQQASGTPPAQDAGERRAVIERAQLLSTIYRGRAARNPLSVERSQEDTEIADTLDALLKLVNP